MAHCKGLAAMPDVKVAYVCDIDSNRQNQAKQATNADQAVGDMRRVLDDKTVDAGLHPRAGPLARPGNHTGL